MQISLVFKSFFLCYNRSQSIPMHKCSIKRTSLSSIETATPTATAHFVHKVAINANCVFTVFSLQLYGIKASN